jgi:glutamine amidotransferase
MARVAVVYSGGENINSVLLGLERVGADVVLTEDPAVVAEAERVVLMGVGAAAPAMDRLRAARLVDCLRSLRQPVLGICLGMQLLFERSAEGGVQCLGVLPGDVRRLVPAYAENGLGRTVPHMGWNRLTLLRPDNPLVKGIASGEHAYFAHSYFVPTSDITIARTDYGGAVAAVVNRANFFGCQFHPEGSRRVGRRILENFLAVP